MIQHLTLTADIMPSFRSHNKNFLLTCDAGGNIKYWSPSIAPVQSVDSHNQQAIHALSFSPSDTKFVSCGDDATVRVWDWVSCHKTGLRRNLKSLWLATFYISTTEFIFVRPPIARNEN